VCLKIYIKSENVFDFDISSLAVFIDTNTTGNELMLQLHTPKTSNFDPEI